MPTYQIHTIASAPEKSKPALEQLQQAFGVIPNLAAVISNSPKLVTALTGRISAGTQQQPYRAGDSDRPPDRRSRELLRVRGGIPHRAGPQTGSEF